MPLEFKLAWIYFRSARKGVVRFTSAVAIIGITAGVASLIIAQALAKGFSDEIRSKILSNTAHISVSERVEAKISNWEIIKQKIEKVKGVVSVYPTSYESAVVSTEKKSGYAIIRVKALEEKEQSDPGKDMVSPITVSIGKELANRLSLRKGNKSEVIIVDESEVPNSANVIVGEIFETGLYEYDSTWIYVSEYDYKRLKNQNYFSPSVFNVNVTDIFNTDSISESIKQTLGENFKVLDWQEANKPLFAALSLEKKVSLAIISLIIFIAALNITTTLALLVNERNMDIAILRICGAKTRVLILTFLLEGIILSGVGIMLGTGVGLLGCFVGNYFKLVRLSKEVYSLNYVPLHPDPMGMTLIGLLTIFLCFAAILYPALRASSIKPLETFRTQ